LRRWCECDVRILVTGATGRLGRDMVLELAGRGHDVTGLGHQDMDVSNCFGIYHVTNQGVVTRYEFAKTIFQKVGLPVEVRATSSEEFATPARRPKNSELDPFPLAETIGYLLPPWEDALTRYLEQKTLQTQTPDLIDSQASPHGRQGR